MNIDEIGLKVKNLIKKAGTLKRHQVKEMNNIFNEIKLLSAARNKIINNVVITEPVITEPVITEPVITEPVNKSIERVIMYSEIPHQHIKMVVKKK